MLLMSHDTCMHLTMLELWKKLMDVFLMLMCYVLQCGLNVIDHCYHSIVIRKYHLQNQRPLLPFHSNNKMSLQCHYNTIVAIPF